MPKVLVENSPVYYAQLGRGRPLLFVHGSGADHTLWGGQLQGLKGQFSVGALDLNGHGQSPPRPGDDLTSYVADVAGVLADLGDQTVLAGHSLGSAVALSVALEHPELIGGLILIGAGARLRVLPELLQAIADDFPAAVDSIVKLAFSAAAREPERRQARDQMLRNGQAALYRDFSACDRFNLMAQLERIKVPTLIICGREDRLTPVKYAEYLRDHLPDAQLHIIEKAGHMVMLEAAEPLNRLIASFVGEQDAA